MSLPLSVIIPALDEEQRIGSAIDSAFAAGAGEVIVCDGGSRDATVSIAESRGARVIRSEPMRSRQLNEGAQAARFDYIAFLHADSALPKGAGDAICTALSDGVVFGGFRIDFTERALRLRVASAMINLRTFFSRCPWGDQAQFIRRETFLEDGGFRAMPLLEDYELAVRMRRRGRTRVLPLRVTTSGRRFLKKGVWRTAALNWRIILAYRFGADVAKLARLYRS
ncbi:MAG: TIGR04283 family arsenosugar biosynthesis glycosyltransferase [Thermoanaerobaculia bacterium]